MNAADTFVTLLTSGTTGKPKPVSLCMDGFETDDGLILHDWGEHWYGRRVVSTISPHHIFGFIFACLVPFTGGIPFNRRRVEQPDELFAVCAKQDSMIITVPAFLKRVAELPDVPVDAIRAHSHYIYEAGGFLPPPVAKRAMEIFGFWPMEIYGSTEASGIAWLQSRNGPAWTPFGNRKLWVNQDPSKGPVGCLALVADYAKNPDGVVTGDMVDMLPDGKFIMKGRAETFVKIEEVRVSLLEVETQLRESGLVADVALALIEDTREYLAAAIVLNDKGKAQFAGKDKLEINKYFRDYLADYFEQAALPRKWRYPDALPADDQGKRPQEMIAALFDSDG
jgi:acyl-coenzyme A synthetase/AMP-(fatty) acid ligase